MNWLASEHVHSFLLTQINPTDTTFASVPDWFLEKRPPLPDDYPFIVTPLVGQTTSRGVRIVAGFRRFKSAQIWKLKRIPFLLAAPEFPAAELLKIAIVDNRSQRDLTLLEMSTIVGKMVDQWGHSRQQVSQEILPLLGLPSQKHHLRRLLRLSRLSQPLLQWLDVVEEEILFGLASWPRKDQSFLLERLVGMRLGRNKQRQLWQLLNELRDLLGREEEWLSRAWEKSGSVQVEQFETLSPADRFQRIWRGLRELRYPRLTALEARQVELTKALSLPPSVQVSLPRFFEGDQIELRLTARSPEQVRELLEALSKAADSSEMAKLFELL